MSEIRDYKCPNCGGAVSFDSASQTLKCPFCETEFTMEALQQYNEELSGQPAEDMTWADRGGSEWSEDETSGLRSFVCKSCGGEIVGDANMGATTCPFCGNNVIVAQQFSGSLKPDFVIPFKYDKKAAKEALKKHYQGKKLLPKVFRDENYIEEVKGVYVPFWIFDADADANVRYKATKTKTWSDEEREYTKTSYYSVIRAGSLGFERVPVDGSSKMADDLMESLEPFDAKDLTDFNSGFLAGYYADKYDVDEKASEPRANERIINSTMDELASTVTGYDTVSVESASIRLHDNKVRYALYPVWLLTTKWNGGTYTFAMNGQTGKMIGDLPLDKGAYRKWLFGLGFGLSAICFVLSYLIYAL